MEQEAILGYLQFDNLNFKLAVIQHLAFDTGILKVNHGLGDFDNYRVVFKDYDTALQSYCENALVYYERLQIPAYLAAYVDELIIRIDDDIYLDVYPDWCGEEAFFKINDISVREAKQFPYLKKITFIDTTSQGSMIKKKLKPLGIMVDYSRSKNKKRERQIPLLISIFVLFASVTIVSALFVYLHAGYLTQVTDNVGMKVEGEVAEGHSDPSSWNGMETEIDKEAEEGYSGLEQSYYDLGEYQYEHVIFLYKDDTILDDRGLLVSEDGKQWYLITDDYSDPIPVNTDGYDEIAYTGIVNISADIPYYFDLVTGIQTKE